MPEITLTPEQLKKIREDMDKKVSMLSDEEINTLAKKVNAKIDIPIFFKEDKELIIFAKIIRWIDKICYKNLPNEVYELIKSTHDGISKKESEAIRKRLVPIVNNVVNIPILTEKREADLINLILKLLMSALIKGLNIQEVKA